MVLEESKSLKSVNLCDIDSGLYTLHIQTVLDVAAVQATNNKTDLVRGHGVQRGTQRDKYWFICVTEMDDELENGQIKCIDLTASQHVRNHRHLDTLLYGHCPLRRSHFGACQRERLPDQSGESLCVSVSHPGNEV